MPGLTLSNPDNSTKKTKTFGSFRNTSNLKSILPEDLFSAVFGDIPDNLDIAKLVTFDGGKGQRHFLNHAAFGKPYGQVLDLSLKLRQFAESNPDVFYDQACLPLVENTYKVLEEFLGTDKLVLVPNCTTGMKCVLDHLTKEGGHRSVAQLSPLYGATQKLLEFYRTGGDIDRCVKVSPRRSKTGARSQAAMFEEDPSVIVEALEDALAMQEFSVLVCDQVSSQSGRILPLDAVSRFCQDNGIILVVDGTQSCELFFNRNMKEQLDNVDYFVMSSHKWLGNIRTCGVVRFKSIKSAPSPPVISFGWSQVHNRDKQTLDQVRSQFMWIGMTDYIPYITLGKAVRIFSKYGEAQMLAASLTLEKGLVDGLHLKPILPKTFKPRVINLFELESSQLNMIGDATKIQNALQDYGIFVSVKKHGNSGCADESNGSEITPVKQNGQCSPTKKKSFNECAMNKVKFYVRVSCWSYTSFQSFQALNQVLNNNLSLSTSTPMALEHQFLFMYYVYEALFSTLKTKAFFIRAERLRHHLIFYYAHTAVFYINKLVISGFLQPSQRIDPGLESVMSVGVDEMSWDDYLEDNYEWSAMDDDQLEDYLTRIKNYRRKVRDLVLGIIDTHPVEHPIAQNSIHWVILMGMEHEKIHLETSAVIISQVPLELIKDEHDWNFPTFYNDKSNQTNVMCSEDAPYNTLVRIPGGTVQMGKDHHGADLYAWDNEFGSEKKVLRPFTASQMLVSNAEYLDFVEAGGYTKLGLDSWWSEEGKRYVLDLDVTGPRFWIGKTHYRAMLEAIPMPWDFPVEVNNLEAEAFCRWKSHQTNKSLRLISHEESFHMRQIGQKQTSNSNLNKYASPTPVNLFGGIINGKKVFDISGNVWRHSVSVLTVMEGFKTDPFYNDFTLPTIDGFHNHILGGSWISLGNCSNLNARYGFRRHFYQYAGIRYVCSDNDYHNKVMKIFDGISIGKQTTEHFTDFTDVTLVQRKPIKNWPERFGQLAADQINQESHNGKVKVLVAHGGVGRSTLELLKNCQDLNIDYTDTTANSLQVLEHLLEYSKIQWYQQVEGNLVELRDFHMKDIETSDRILKEKGNSISYWQADYTNLRPQLDGYKVILADFRTNDAVKEIVHLASKLEEGGLLVLGTIEMVQPNMAVTNKTMEFLEKMFEPVASEGSLESYPHIYKETRNKHQYAISYFSVWRKISDQDIQDQHQVEEESVSNVPTQYYDTEVYYEDQAILRSYDQFHFGEGLLGVKNFPQRMAEVCLEMCQKYRSGMTTALDAGCGPGRTALELCEKFDNVEAYDYSQGFVDMMNDNMKKRGISNLKAYQGDSHKQAELTSEKFDLIFGCNLIDRLHNPESWLRQSKQMLRVGGLLVISSPYTWRDEHTNMDKWVGGFLKDGENYFTVDGLKEQMAPEYVLLEERKVPFVIPDKDGTYQYTYSNVTVFGCQEKLTQ